MDACPKCGTSWIGELIPPEMRDCFGSATHWRREIGIDGGYMGIYDGVVAWQCPDCKEEMPRGNSPWALEMFRMYQEKKG